MIEIPPPGFRDGCTCMTGWTGITRQPPCPKHGEDRLSFLDALLKPAPAKPKSDIPANAMRVAPGSDAVVWRICPDHGGEL